MICYTFEVQLGSRAYFVVADSWQSALSKAVRHDPDEGTIPRTATSICVQVRYSYDVIVEDDFRLCQIQSREVIPTK